MKNTKIIYYFVLVSLINAVNATGNMTWSKLLMLQEI